MYGCNIHNFPIPHHKTGMYTVYPRFSHYTHNSLGLADYIHVEMSFPRTLCAKGEEKGVKTSCKTDQHQLC